MWQLSKFPLYVKLICEFQCKATTTTTKQRGEDTRSLIRTQTAKQIRDKPNNIKISNERQQISRHSNGCTYVPNDHFTNLCTTKSSNINFNAWMKQAKRNWTQQIADHLQLHWHKTDEIHIELSSHIDFHNFSQLHLNSMIIIIAFVQKPKSYTVCLLFLFKHAVVCLIWLDDANYRCADITLVWNQNIEKVAKEK